MGYMYYCSINVRLLSKPSVILASTETVRYSPSYIFFLNCMYDHSVSVGVVFSGSLRQYFSLFRAFLPERGKKKGERKKVQAAAAPPPAPTAGTVDSGSIIQINRCPEPWTLPCTVARPRPCDVYIMKLFRQYCVSVADYGYKCSACSA